MRIVVWTVRLAAVATLLFTLGCATGSRVVLTDDVKNQDWTKRQVEYVATPGR